jgi:hypothetical protein
MNEQNNDFEALRKLLSLKQHEVPPPGYFHGFSSEVVARIRTGDVGHPESFGNRLQNEAPWLFRLISGFQDRPAYAGMFASFLLLLLAAGIVYTDNPSASQADLVLPGQGTDPGTSMASVGSSSTGFLDPAGSSGIASGAPGLSVSSTNPVSSLEPSLASFGSQNPLFQPAGFSH